MDASSITAIALGIALSACCGFRIFIPLLAGSIAAYNHWFQVPVEMQWVGSLPALICFATASVVEVVAYYFPFVDNILDTIATPTAAAAGTLMAATFFPIGDFDPMLRWVMAIITGGAAAGTIQAGTGLLRLFSTKATLGSGNSLVATGENTAALVGAVSSLIVPVVVAVIMVILVGWLGYKGIRRIKSKKTNLP
jgi:Domain of unknown function (DUF4126)